MNDEELSVDRLFRELNQRGELLYRFVMLYYSMMNTQRDYGTGDVLTTVEVHMLTQIEENPAITNAELAVLWLRSASAVSQTVTKLVKKGLVEKKKEKGNKKTVHLYVTEEGALLSLSHKKYDIADIMETLQILRKDCSSEEIDTFYKVLRNYLNILEAEI